jgi:hypothetical protein
MNPVQVTGAGGGEPPLLVSSIPVVLGNCTDSRGAVWSVCVLGVWQRHQGPRPSTCGPS